MLLRGNDIHTALFREKSWLFFCWFLLRLLSFFRVFSAFPRRREGVAEHNKPNSPPSEGWPRSGRGGCNAVGVMLHAVAASISFSFPRSRVGTISTQHCSGKKAGCFFVGFYYGFFPFFEFSLHSHAGERVSRNTTNLIPLLRRGGRVADGVVVTP